jgi:hypothetical protein
MPTNMSNNARNQNDRTTLLLPPVIIATGNIATGATSNLLQKQTKCQKKEKLIYQGLTTQWHTHRGSIFIPTNNWDERTIMAKQVEMCHQGLALRHEAASLLTEWFKFRCPRKTGQNWTVEEMQAAIDRGSHQSMMQPEALQTLMRDLGQSRKGTGTRGVMG